MPSHEALINNEAIKVTAPTANTSTIVVCEHASNWIPEEFEHLGLDAERQTSHIAWDPGALSVAAQLAEFFGCLLVQGNASRLLFDCNRPPEAADAVPEKSEIFDIPGNKDLSDIARSERVTRFHDPFRHGLIQTLDQFNPTIMVTIHSFTPTYRGADRNVEIGILHDTDPRLADEMLRIADFHTDMIVSRNDPYGPEHGVTHTLKSHAIPRGMFNVMIEIRNDLIKDSAAQRAMVESLCVWIADAMTAFGVQMMKRET